MAISESTKPPTKDNSKKSRDHQKRYIKNI